jgi:hypothetical protein
MAWSPAFSIIHDIPATTPVCQGWRMGVSGNGYPQPPNM